MIIPIYLTKTDDQSTSINCGKHLRANFQGCNKLSPQILIKNFKRKKLIKKTTTILKKKINNNSILLLKQNTKLFSKN